MSSALIRSLAMLGWLLALKQVRAQDCTQAEIDACALARRSCVSTTDCGPCLSGFVEFPNRGCFDISELNLEDFLAEFEPTYNQDRTATPGDRATRLELLQEAAAFISEFYLNSTSAEFDVGLTPFSADGEDEYKQRSGFDASIPLGDFAAQIPQPTAATVAADITSAPLPDKVDWRDRGAVTSVKDQGRCGSCWAFSMVGAIEGAAAVRASERGEEYLQNLSWQQLISCNDANAGCNGGSLFNALGYSWLNNFGGLTRDNEYPYTDYQGDTTDACSLESKPLAVEISEPKIILDFGAMSFERRVVTMKEALTIAPVSSTMKSACKTISNYLKGIMTDDGDCACSTSSCIDHAILMVGYDDTSSPPCWILKNSWGTKWGEDGYFRISQAEKGNFGLFGVVAHAVHAQMAQNVTKQVEDDYKEPINAWAWVLIGLAIAAAFVCVFGVVRRLEGQAAEEEDVDEK